LAGKTLLVGAGVSFLPPSRLPSGEELARHLIELVLDGPVVYDRSDFDTVLDSLSPQPNGSRSLRLELVCELLARHIDPQVLVRIFGLLTSATPNRNHFGLLLSGARDILTLNQDLLLESAGRRLGQPSDPVFHLHGRADRPQTIVTLISQYLEGLPRHKWQRFRRAIAGRNVVVIGYSGRDRDVMPALVRARPRHVLWLTYAPAGSPTDLSPELAVLKADLGERLEIEPCSDPAGWIERQIGARAARRARALVVGAASPSPAVLAPSVVRRFAAIDETDRNLALARLLDHVAQYVPLRAGLARLRQRPAGRNPETALQLAEAIASLGDRREAARRFQRIAQRYHGDAGIVCEALAARADKLENESDYRAAREALAELRRRARRLPTRERKRLLGIAAEREARMKVMTDDEGGSMRDYARARRLFDESRSLDGATVARVFGADPLRSRGRYREALALLDEAYTDAELFARAYFMFWPRFYRGTCLASMGELDEGLAELAQGEVLAQAAGNDQGVAWMAVARACFERAHDLAAAECAVAVAEAAIRRYGPGMTLAQARVIFERAELHRARGEARECRREIRRLRNWAKRRVPGDVPYLWAHAAAVEAELARDQGASQARGLLRHTLAMYRQGHWTACGARIATSLWLLEGGRPPPWLERLCQRERYGFELARLTGRDTSSYYPLHTM